MQINIYVNFYCKGKKIENVTEFKYLGLFINRANNSPVSMSEHIIKKQKQHLIA